MKSARSIWKWLISFGKRSWDIDDYPISVVQQDSTDPNVPAYRAYINEWLLMGFGETRECALENLSKNFDSFVHSKPGRLPRPGTSLPWQDYLAPHDQIDGHSRTVVRYLEIVLKVDTSGPFFVSDDTTLDDFVHGDTDVAFFVSKTKEMFGVDISDIPDKSLLRICERIDSKKQAS
ncbi:MAG: hypothetical protein JOZ43_08610 [Acidobacteriales bacterium]|nr:hypothetical protein [Terriglobales bacterium]